MGGRPLSRGLFVLSVVSCLAFAPRVFAQRAEPDLRRVSPNAIAATTGTATAEIAGNPFAADHALHPVFEHIMLSEEALADVQDYTAVFTKQEVVGNRMLSQTMQMKFRTRPFSVYLHFMGNEQGRECLFVAGRNNNQLLVKETGIKAIAGAVSLPLNHPMVMQENRHPITQIGIPNIVAISRRDWEQQSRTASLKVEVFPKANVQSASCTAYRITNDQAQPGQGVYQSVVYFDNVTHLPIRAERYALPRGRGQQPVLVEMYTYTQVRTNVGLTDVDFNPRNRAYRFQ